MAAKQAQVAGLSCRLSLGLQLIQFDLGCERKTTGAWTLGLQEFPP
jgi:hypothetical protein